MDGRFYFKSLLFITVAPTTSFQKGLRCECRQFDISYENKCHGGGVTSDER